MIAKTTKALGRNIKVVTIDGNRVYYNEAGRLIFSDVVVPTQDVQAALYLAGKFKQQEEETHEETSK